MTYGKRNSPEAEFARLRPKPYVASQPIPQGFYKFETLGKPEGMSEELKEFRRRNFERLNLH